MSLRRFWFVFDLEGHRPADPAPSSGRTIDGGTVQYQWLSWGAGVAAHDEIDALALLEDVVGAELPPLLNTIQDVEVDPEALGLPALVVIGDPARRGVWLPPNNLGLAQATRDYTSIEDRWNLLVQDARQVEPSAGWFDRGMAPLVLSAHGTGLRQFFPFTSHARLCFAQTGYPFQRLQPAYIQWFPDGNYCVHDVSPYAPEVYRCPYRR